MACVFRREPFADEDMTQVAAAISAQNLRPPSVSIRNVFHSTLDFVIETRPPAMRFKLVFRPVKWSIAAFAQVGAVFLIVQQRTGKRPFRTFMEDDVFLLRGQFIIF